MYRVAVVTSYFPSSAQPYQGHSAYQTLLQLQRWAEIDVYVPLAVYPKGILPKSFPYFRADASYCPAGIRTHYFEYPALPVISRFANGYTCCRNLLPYLKKSKPDLILNYWLYPPGFAAARAGKILDIPVIVCAIGSDLRRIPDPITRRLTRQTLRDASFVVTVSHELREQAIQLGAHPANVQAVLNGCDTSIFKPGDRTAARAELGVSQDSEVILYVGRFDANKGLRELMDAAISLSRSRPRLELVLVGEGLLHNELRERARDAGIGDRVRFPGICKSAGV